MPGQRLNDRQIAEIDRLFRLYGAGVGRYVRARLGNAEAAQEVTSRVFLTVAARIAQCRENAVAWLFAIVRSEVALHRRNHREQDSIPTDALADTADPAEQAAEREMQAALRIALEQLDEDEHRLIYMKFFLQMPNVDVAAACGMTPNHVGVSVYRAIQNLRRLMSCVTTTNNSKT